MSSRNGSDPPNSYPYIMLVKVKNKVLKGTLYYELEVHLYVSDRA